MLQSCDVDATKNPSVSMEAGISAKANFSLKAMYAHSPEEYVAWDDSVSDDTAAPRLGCDGRDRSCMFEAERMKQEASHVQAGRIAGQGISTVFSSPMDVSCSKTATRSNTHHGHFV